MSNRLSSVSRRAVLKGAGVSLGLPWLEAFSTGSARGAGVAAKAPVRIAALYMPNGVNVPLWTPEGKGRDWSLSPALSSLNDLKSDVTVMSGLWNEASKGGDGHYVKEAAILTCTTIKKTPGADIGNGVSMDQLAAQKAGHLTPLPSLELGVAPVAIGVDAVVGYTRIYGSHIAWSGPTTPLAREINPRSVFERLFRASTGQVGNSSVQDKLLLDRVLGRRTDAADGDRSRRSGAPGRISDAGAFVRRACGACSERFAARLEAACAIEHEIGADG